MIYIGIDCGDHTGFAVWDSEAYAFTRIETLKIWQALAEAYKINTAHNGKVKIVFEDARQRKWIPRETSESDYRGKLMGAGSVKRDSKIWEEFCNDNHIPFEAEPPKPGLTKWNAKYWADVIGWKGRTSEHARDAALLVWGRKGIR